MVNFDQIRCSNCSKTQARMCYSKKQLGDWEARIRSHANSRRKGQAEGPKCRNCTGQPAETLECYGCQRELVLEKFSKTQRRNKDKRLCIDCSQERQDREPNVEDAIQEEEILETLEKEAGGQDSVWGTSTMRSALSSVAYSNPLSAPASRADDRVWIRPDGSQAASSTSREDDAESQTSTQMGAASIASTHTNRTWENYKPLERTHPGVRVPGISHSNNQGFAKQNAVKKDADARARARFDRDQKLKDAEPERVSSDDSDDDNDSVKSWEL